MKKENKKTLRNIGLGGSLLSLLIIGLVISMLTLSNISPVAIEDLNLDLPKSPFFNPDVYIRERRNRPAILQAVADNDPGGSASGWLRIVIVENGVKTWLESYNATGDLSGDSEVYGWRDINNTHISSNIRYDTAHEIGIKVRWNTTHAYNTSGSAWMLSWVDAWLNATDPNGCLDHAISSFSCDEYHIANNSNYMWVWYVADHSDNGGYFLDRGCNLTGLRHNFNSYY